jgi:glycine cleavage system H protein
MKLIKGYYYTRNHEWLKVEGEFGYIGVTDYAQHSMGDIVYVELPELDLVITAQDILGVVESVKAASDVYSPISGIVVEVNNALEDTPELINEEPFDAFIAKLKLSETSELGDLLSAEEYEAFCEEIEEE